MGANGAGEKQPPASLPPLPDIPSVRRALSAEAQDKREGTDAKTPTPAALFCYQAASRTVTPPGPFRLGPVAISMSCPNARRQASCLP